MFDLMNETHLKMKVLTDETYVKYNGSGAFMNKNGKCIDKHD